MSLWALVNSPIVVAGVSFFLAGVVGAALSHRWQRCAKLIEIQLMQFRELETAYHRYYRLLNGDVSRLGTEDWEAAHVQLHSLSKSNRPLFRTELARTGWANVVQHMATLRDLRLKGEVANMRDRLDEIRTLAEQVRCATIKEIVG
jgi:hypothetical protein